MNRRDRGIAKSVSLPNHALEMISEDRRVIFASLLSNTGQLLIRLMADTASPIGVQTRNLAMAVTA